MNLTTKQWLEISQDLEQHHAIFEEMWQIGRPNFTDELPTAAIRFSEDGEFVEFIFNPFYWENLTPYERLFVICHECLHIILSHGLRTTIHKDHQRINWALDIVVNHLLLRCFGFDRSRIRDAATLCWTDTVFEDRDDVATIPTDESYEYYYQLIPDAPTIEVYTVDDHSTLNGEAKKVIEKLNERLSPEEKEALKDIIQKHFQKKQQEGQASNGSGGWTFVKVSKVVRKKKWETIIRKWSLKYIKDGMDDNEQWARIARRFELLPSDILLPSEMEDDAKDFDRIPVHLYLDNSGSCSHLKDRFFQAALSLPKERFDVRCFSFDTKIKELDLEKKKIFGGGGTNFGIIENNIQKIMRSEKTAYPKAIFIISDGQGSVVNPEFPDRWHWFLTDRGSQRYISDESKVYKLRDFE
jgi:hypothetical protein